MHLLSIAESKQFIQTDKPYILDVRTQKEVAEGIYPGAHHIPVNELMMRSDEIPDDKAILIYCALGGRAKMAAMTLEEMGFKNVHSVQGPVAQLLS